MKNAIDACRAWIAKEWDIHFTHIPCEDNNITDSIAKFAIRNHYDWVEFKEPHVECNALLANDC